MSHELEVIDGFAQAMFERVAWHRLGTVVGANFGWQDAIAENLSITFPVRKVALGDVLTTLPIGDDFDGPAPRAQASDFVSLRSDGLVIASGLGEQWTPFQASEGYAFGQAIREQAEVDGVRCDLKSLGTIQDGRKWFMTFDLGEFHIGEYAVRDYLSVNGSYDSSWPLCVLSSPTIEVCANTIAAAYKGGIKHYRFKHTSGIFNRVEEAKRALIQHAANRKVLKELGETLLTRSVTPTEYGQLLNALFPVEDDTPSKTKKVNEDAREKVTTLYKAQSGPQVVSHSGNAWAVVQAVNTYENWAVPIRKTAGRSESQVRALRQIESLQSGKQPLTDKTFGLLGVGA